MSDTRAPRGPYRNVDGVIYCGELVIARMCIDRGPRTGDLLAAAPDLLEALETMVLDFIDYPAYERPCHAFDLAHAALAKAKGESK